MNPRDAAQQVEHGVTLPDGTEERFSGYGLMGQPFTSGHILGLRRFVATSIGPGYKSVWHRNPEGEWTFYQDAPPLLACPRYFGNELHRTIQVGEINIVWSNPWEFRVSINGNHQLDWRTSLRPTPATRLMNSMGSLMPNPMWRNPVVLKVMGGFASLLLGAGHLGLTGNVPNGQGFLANPRQIWTVVTSSARIEGEDVGTIGPLQVQSRLGDFWIPQRGIFAIGNTFFDVYDPARHLQKISRLDGMVA